MSSPEGAGVGAGEKFRSDAGVTTLINSPSIDRLTLVAGKGLDQSAYPPRILRGDHLGALQIGVLELDRLKMYTPPSPLLHPPSPPARPQRIARDPDHP